MKEELESALQELQDAFYQFDNTLKEASPDLWARWNAGGKAVTDEFVSMYPSAEEAVDEYEEPEEEEPDNED